MLRCTAPLALLALCAVSCGAIGVEGGSSNFEPQCVSDNDYGWPRFNSVDELEADERWAEYFSMVYGELPGEYPVCVNDFAWIDIGAWQATGLNETRTAVTDATKVAEGDLFRQYGLGGVELIIYHEAYAPLPNNTWVEVTHAVLPNEQGVLWAFRRRGTGLWVNTGNTLVYDTPADASRAHLDAMAFLTANCSVPPTAMFPKRENDAFGPCAREKGIGSVQFRPQQGQAKKSTFGSLGTTELALAEMTGNETCGSVDPTASQYRSGWRASQSCACNNEPIDPTCGLMPFPPPGVEVDPPLCTVQITDPSIPCNALKCTKSFCDVRRTPAPRKRSGGANIGWMYGVLPSIGLLAAYSVHSIKKRQQQGRGGCESCKLTSDVNADTEKPGSEYVGQIPMKDAAGY